MIDIMEELAGFPSIDPKVYAELPDNIKNSLILYNKAIENLRMGSEDIAIIELKKAISMNPHFHEAMNLLGVCYMYVDEADKAEEAFQRVVSEENNCMKALKYIEKIKEGEQPYAGSSQKKKPAKKKPIVKSSEIVEFSPSSDSTKPLSPAKRSNLVKLIAIFAAGLAVMFVVGIATGLISFSKKDTVTTMTGPDQQQSAKSTTSTTNNTSAANNEKINAELAQLKNDLKNALDQNEYYKNSSKLQEAENFNKENKFEAAADLLVQLKGFAFKDPEKARFEKLYAEVIPKAITPVFDDGMALFNGFKYAEALDKFKKLTLYSSDWKYMDNILYYMGKCYTETKDLKNAEATYKKLKETYPSSEFAKWAEVRLAEISGKP